MFTRYVLVLFSFALCTSILSCTPSKKTVGIDSIPLSATTYDGYRLSIVDLSIKKKKKKSTIIEYSLINTGRNHIDVQRFVVDNTPILFEFDHSLAANEMEGYKNEIISKLLGETLRLSAGQSDNNRSMKLSSKKSAEEETGFTINVGGGSSSSGKYYDKNYCPDLQIDTIKILKLTKKWVTIEYKVTNIGKGPASLSGETKDENDNLFIRAHISGATRMSRGAFAVGGAYISDRDVLEAGDTYTGVLRVNIKKRTRYTSNLILELDAYSSVRECNETNNQNFIFIK